MEKFFSPIIGFCAAVSQMKISVKALGKTSDLFSVVYIQTLKAHNRYLVRDGSSLWITIPVVELRL